MAVTQIKKRRGDIVSFDQGKLEKAISKAFIAVKGHNSDELIEEIAAQIIAELEARFADSTPHVEHVQNLVEETLMKRGYFDVARSYIIYRYEHAKIRQEEKKEVYEKLTQNILEVTKRNGQRETFNLDKIKQTLRNNMQGYELIIDIDEVCNECQTSLYDQISTNEVGKALVLAVRARIERDPAYSHVAARLQTQLLYKEVIGDHLNMNDLTTDYQEAFKRNIRKGIEFGIYDPRLLLFNLDEMAQMIQIDRDDKLEYLGLQVLMDRYFSRSPKTKLLLETPQMFWMRIGMGLAILEKDKESVAKSFYDLTSTLRYVPSTPTLFHAGTAKPQLSSCYLSTIEDDLQHIFKSIADNAQLSKWSGGIGNDWTNLRGMGAWIHGNNVESQGIIPFLKIANDTTVAINRSGRRRGATCAYLETWHWDIEDYLELKRNTGDERRRAHDMNTANWVPDLFMKRVEEDANWTLFSPDEVPDLHHLYGKAFQSKYELYEKKAAEGEIRLHRTIRARDLWKKMISMIFETGHPWITFKDPSNVRSPQDHVGVIHNSNLCTEITLNTSADETAVCNLGSINLAEHIKGKELDRELIAETIKLAMRMLDNVIDLCFYPTKEAKYSNMRHRPVGLGIMGLQDALYKLDINFDTEAAVEFSDVLMEFISYHAIWNSSLLAAERGAYTTFRGSKWDRGLFPVDTLGLLEQERGNPIDIDKKSRMDWTPVRESVAKFGMRNSNTMAIAPTATIANIAGCFPSIEPIYKNVYVKSNMSGEFAIVNSYLIDDLKAMGLWSQALLNEIKRRDGDITDIDIIPKVLREKYKETFGIDAEWMIKAAAYRGKWIDQSQSLNIFLKTNSGKRIADVYMHAWNMGLKTTYYLRTLAATSVEKSTIDLATTADGPEVQLPNISSVNDAVSVQAAADHKVLEGIIASVASSTVEVPDIKPMAEPEMLMRSAPVGATEDASPASPAQDMGSIATATATAIKDENGETRTLAGLCLIDDPDCEACQ